MELKERSAAQSHFNDLCRLLGEATPTDADPKGSWYCFERGATKTTGGEGWADVWKREHFGWEYKGKRKDLDAAFGQLQSYALALENPPLLVVSDMDRFRIHTNWTNTVSKTYEYSLDDLAEPAALRTLKSVLTNPENLKPGLTREALTRDAARRFAALAQALRSRGHEALSVAHFINRLVFCMFAEDCGLLSNMQFSRMLNVAAGEPHRFVAMTRELFGAMRSGGMAGWEPVRWFNGGLFKDDRAIPLTTEEIESVRDAAKLDWSDIDPSIFGTLFEAGLDPDKRSQLGAHYTDAEKIRMIVKPVIEEPLQREWETEKGRIVDALARSDAARSPSARTKARNEAERILRGFLDRLRRFRLLDPACGSGNFLHLGLLCLKDLEHRVGIEAEALGLPREFPQVGPEAVLGIEINPYAAELARVSVWIGDIQWMRRNGFGMNREPILRSLDTIRIADAVIDVDGTEPEWPAVDAIVGNPPFLGGKLLRTLLGDDTVERLFALYGGRVPAEADLVCYWIAKAWKQVQTGKTARVGLVATNSLRGGANRRVLMPIADQGAIFEAWSDEPWIINGAAVRVSLVAFDGAADDRPIRLDGVPVTRINADLTSTACDVTKAARLRENAGVAFMGDTKGGAFDIDGDLARRWLAMPLNPNGRPNADVLRPWMNGMDVVRRPSGKWIIDFGWEMSETEAALFEQPFKHVLANVKPERDKNNREAYRRNWWRHAEPRPGMWACLRTLKRFIVTPEVSKHRVFAWMEHPVVPDHKLQVIAREDDTSFGILNSRFHRAWSLAVGSWHGIGNDPRYTIGTCFETFPFPEGLSPTVPVARYEADPRAQGIAEAARRLDEWRQNWLNPDDQVIHLDEVAPGFPRRVLPKDDKAAALLKKRTLTALYNERPAWLVHAHDALDEAVATAYGWPVTLTDEEVLVRLLELNRHRAGDDTPRRTGSATGVHG
ncbi:type II restriction/modification system DNA methylase subunit YeeA [Azospirillum baldaniorum]|nr:class I SAM-dependent DNA methyltransferase [Azospirillum baldaniorum]TWA69712.1 type II restriction/modification system DNA methylase subunit YeeA [Azospirillum baldaniorum]